MTVPPDQVRQGRGFTVLPLCVTGHANRDLHQRQHTPLRPICRPLSEPANGQPRQHAGSRGSFSVFSGREGERHGYADASHTRPWHNHSAVAGILCAAIVTALLGLRQSTRRPARAVRGWRSALRPRLRSARAWQWCRQAARRRSRKDRGSNRQTAPWRVSTPFQKPPEPSRNAR